MPRVIYQNVCICKPRFFSLKKGRVEGRDWVLLKSRWRSSLYLILIGNEIQAKEGEKPTMFSLLRVSIGERKGAASQIFKTQIFYWHVYFFFLAEFLCLHLKKKISFHTWQSFLCLSATCHPPSVFSMQLVPRTRRVLFIRHTEPRAFPESWWAPFEASHEVIFNSWGSFWFLEEWGIWGQKEEWEKNFILSQNLKVLKSTSTFCETSMKR